MSSNFSCFLLWLHKLYSGGSTILTYLKMTRECFIVLSIIMISQYDDLRWKRRRCAELSQDDQREKNEKGIKGMLKKCHLQEKSTKFLRRRSTNGT